MKLLSFITVCCLTMNLQNAFAQYVYPVPKKIPQVETRYNILIEDAYKWMENPSDPDLWSWIEEQKAFTAQYLDSNIGDAFASRTLELRKIREDQTKITDAASNVSLALTSPWIEEDLRSMGIKEKRFQRWNQKRTQLKSTAIRTESVTYKIQSQAVHNGDLRRVIISQKTDNKVVDILLVKFYSFVAWADDNSFYYISDLDERIGGGRPGLFKHTVGEIQSEDQLLLTGKNSNSRLVVHQIGTKFFAEVDGMIGSLQLSTGKISNKIFVNGEIVEINEEDEVEATIRTFQNANNGELHKLRLRDGSRRIFLKEQHFVVEKGQRLAEGFTLVMGLLDGSQVAGIYTSSGLKMISALQNGSIEFISFSDDVLKLSFETYHHPKKVFTYNIATEELKEIAAQTYPIEIEAKKIYYTASNGQRSSLWVMHKKGTKLTATTPMIMFGYGGFKVSITPVFGIYESLSWMEKGGAMAVPTIPGSFDYGYSWWNIARNDGRIHSWDSFALAAKELFKRGWTSPDHIGMMGASNGGTLVAGTLERHAEVFKAAVPIVGVMDLLNFPLFTAGKYWTDDYGNPFKEKEFRGIFPISPYHNLKRRSYPATLVMTAEFDDRVVPMHSYKYVARLQELNTSHAPVLLYNKEWGGHGRTSGSTRESSRFVSAFYTFFAQQLGL